MDSFRKYTPVLCVDVYLHVHLDVHGLGIMKQIVDIN